MRRLVLALIAVGLVAVSALAIALSTGMIGWIGVKGTIKAGASAELKPSSIDVAINITSEKGEKVYRDIAVLKVTGGTVPIQFKAVESSVEGGASITMSGEIVLEGPENHRITMPCLLSTGFCARIMMLIPGYDVPLMLSPGEYRVTLKLAWTNARGEGTVRLKIGVFASEPEASLSPISTGTAPENATGWASAPNSTKSYALLIEKTTVKAGSDGYGRLRAWAWLFSPGDRGPVTFNFTLINTAPEMQGSRVAAELSLRVEWKKPYYQAIILVAAKPGTYVLRVSMGNVTLESPKITVQP